MPELPEVEVLVRHLAAVLRGRTIRSVAVHRDKIIRPSTRAEFAQALRGATFHSVGRRGKYLVFALARRRRKLVLLGHLGMTGRMYLAPAGRARPKHAAVVLGLGRRDFIFLDPRLFGRMTLDDEPLGRLGPEPLARGFTAAKLAAKLARSRQPVKIRLMDQAVVAGLGNIYASEILFRAGLAPDKPANRLRPEEIQVLWRVIRVVVREAIRFGSTAPLDWAGNPHRGALFYYGRRPGARDYVERLRVYDRAGQPCFTCGTAIDRQVQGARSTYFCRRCQK